MAVDVEALIEHKLTPEEILKLPERLQVSANKNIAGQWAWTVPNINTEILHNIWTRKSDYFINNPWGIEDFAFLKKDYLTLDFISSNLVTFHSSLRLYVYEKNKNLRDDFNCLTKEILNLLNAVDVLIIPELSNVSFLDDEPDFTINIYRQKAKEHNSFVTELK